MKLDIKNVCSTIKHNGSIMWSYIADSDMGNWVFIEYSININIYIF